ncbi:hypothetical protein BW425_10350 [Bacillus pseudomycoides]|uniref:Uncharacterized protein n=1 Tax=Bacillus pseudomycoides TaxID=64104 RepID=A0A1Y3MEZ9_9BACI|nr:hypothetical protein BW425_10350 [Bacillus pseudomycoides]PEK70881.1 hypothetical protein CN590_06380 [Bacillus pseudomycoides]PEL26068.1 hypothetical protein CN608_13955 [Bacillus pseudomycoides]PGE83809.1 hypothetical protein COM55_18725 [Bacillus pseudomycoides]
MTVTKTKSDLHSFSLFVFTWHGAGKRSDRFYAWTDALYHLKKGLYWFFNIYSTFYLTFSYS